MQIVNLFYSQKREVTIQRVDGILGLSVRGGAEHSLPLIVSRLIPGSPAALCKQIYIGDAVISSENASFIQISRNCNA